MSEPLQAVISRQRKGRIRLVVLVLLASLVIGAAGWVWKERSDSGPARKIVTAAVETGDVTESITATGTVQAVETVQIGALVSGRVLSLGADENDEVKAGEVLAVIDPEPYRARLEQAEAQLAIAVASSDRAKAEARRAARERDRVAALGERGAAGSAAVDDAESAVELARAAEKGALAEASRARAALKAARLDLERTTIVSPIDGVVLARLVEVGQSVTAGFQTPTLLTVARDLGEMEVRAAIDEADVGKVREGQSAKFNVDAYPGEDFVGTIAAIKRSPTVTQNVVTYEALIRVKNPDKKLWPGMTATVRVTTAERKGVVRVPNAALRFKPPAGFAPPSEVRGRKLYRMVDGKPVAAEVKLGISDEEYTEVVSGLAAGDQVVTEVQGASAAPQQRGGGARGPLPGQQGGGRRRF